MSPLNKFTLQIPKRQAVEVVVIAHEDGSIVARTAAELATAAKGAVTAAALLVLVLLAPRQAAAQTPIVIGPASTLAWDISGLTPPQAQACTYQVSAGAAAFSPVVGVVTCAAPVAPATLTSCSVNLLAQTAIPIGSGSVRMTATCSGVTSLPSTPFVYVDLVVPVPQNVGFRN